MATKTRKHEENHRILLRASWQLMPLFTRLPLKAVANFFFVPSSSEADPRRELKCPRPAGAERLAHALVRLPECRRHHEVVVEVRQVRDIENVEDLADQPQFSPLGELDGFHHPHVLRRK